MFSRSLGKGEDFRLPRWTKILYVPTLLLLLLVLTNDLHQQVFSFPSGVLSDQAYRYESGYFFVLVGEALRAGFALFSMVKTAASRAAGEFAVPLVPLALLPCLRVRRKGPLGLGLRGRYDGVAVPDLCGSILECCIQCGLIQSNLGYDELFEATSLPVQITDPGILLEICVLFSAMQEALPQSELQQMQDTTHLDYDTLLKRHKAALPGWVFWKEDISALNQSRKELELTRDELRDTGDVLTAEKAQHARWLKLTEENRLYDMMEAQTARQIAMLRDLLAELQKTEDSNRARHLLGRVIIIGTYIKRRSNLIFVGVQRGSIRRAGNFCCASMNLPRISVSMAPTVRRLSRGRPACRRAGNAGLRPV